MIPAIGFPKLPVGANIYDTVGAYSNVRTKAQEYWNYLLNSAGFFIEYDTSVTDYYQIIQDALNTWPKVVLGRGETEVFRVSQPVMPNSYNILEINGTIKPMDSLTSLITEDISVGASSFKVANPSYFSLGQWVGVTDDVQYSGYATLRAWAGWVVSIIGNTITVDNVSAYNYQVSQNARCSHCQNAVLVYQKENVHIYGRGIIDGNRYGQDQLHPVYGIGPAENQNAGCSISVFESKNTRINDVNVIDGLMHNVAVHALTLPNSCENVWLDSVKSIDGHDKNFLVRLIKNVWITNCFADGATWEDGLMFYSGVDGCFLDNLKSINNKRYGFGWSSGINYNLNANNIYTEGNYELGIYLRAPRWNLTNIISKDPAWITSSEDLYDGFISNWQMLDVNTANHLGADVLTLRSDIKDVTINGLLMKGCSGTGIKSVAVSGKVPIRTKISNWSIVNHTGTEIDLTAGGDVAFYNPT